MNKVKVILLKVKVILLIVCFGALALGIFWMIFSGMVGKDVGSAYGNTVGIGIGSFKSVGEFKNAYDEGTSIAEQVKDTEVTMGTKVDNTGEKLQVLAAKTTVKNVLEYTDQSFNWNKYKRLETLDIEIIFTVDLSKAQVANNLVVIPIPEVSLYNDESARKVLATYQALPFVDSAEDGFNIALNSTKELMSNAEETLSNYDALYSQAKESAKKQVAALYRSMNVEGKEVSVIFDYETEAGDR